MKKGFILIAFLGVFANLHAQNTAEAKAAYLLAEEDFNAGKYASSISYLDQAIAKLGSANAKILYLKIMALQVLAQEDEANLEPLKAAISAFEKSPDFDAFNEEKQLEVMKLKLKLGRDGGLGRSVNPLEARAYSRMGISGWQVGVNLEDMKQAHPDFFSKAKKTALGDTATLYQLESEQYFSVYEVRGKVTGISKLLLMNVADDASYSTGTNTLAGLKNELGADPEEKVSSSGSPFTKWGAGYATILKTLTWKSKEVQVAVSLTTSEIRPYKQPRSYTSYLSVGVGYLRR